MPELPEVEVVRRGLDRMCVGRSLTEISVLHPRVVRRHAAGRGDFATRLHGTRVTEVDRRGKYLWLVLDSSEALLAHLGMSGQLLVRPAAARPENHLRLRCGLGPPDAAAEPAELRFVDQRTFGHMLVAPLGRDRGGGTVPLPIGHIARDPLDPAFDDGAFCAALTRRRVAVKRALLDQSLISGVGNIYADESLWRAGLHGESRCDRLSREAAADLLDRVRQVLTEALRAGGTTFDGLYVNVNGESGYFSRDLAVYGRAGRACRRCGAPIVRESFTNRSSYSCPRCQPPPHRE